MKAPILLRAIIYMILAALPELIKYLSIITEQIYGGVTPPSHWSITTLTGTNMVYQAILALRIFLDGSAERSRQADISKITPPSS
jgi:hypothetical protein